MKVFELLPLINDDTQLIFITYHEDIKRSNYDIYKCLECLKKDFKHQMYNEKVSNADILEVRTHKRFNDISIEIIIDDEYCDYLEEY